MGSDQFAFLPALRVREAMEAFPKKDGDQPAPLFRFFPSPVEGVAGEVKDGEEEEDEALRAGDRAAALVSAAAAAAAAAAA